MKATIAVEFSETTPNPAAAAQIIAYDPASGAHQVTLLAAGHAPGLYSIARAIVQLGAGATTGSLALALAWKPPHVAAVAPAAPMIVGTTNPGQTTRLTWEHECGATSAVGGSLHVPTSPIVVASDGTADVVVSITPGPTTAPASLFDAYFVATLIGPIATIEP